MPDALQPLALETAAAELVHRLGGVWRPPGAMCRCPAHDDRTPSLSVRIGSKSLLFKCFAGCSAIEILRAVRRLDFTVPILAAPAASSVEPVSAGLAGAAHRLWDQSVPLAGSPGEAYLARRGLSLRPPDLRFNARTPLGRGRQVRFRPAIIAAVRTGRTLVAVQRLFLASDRPALADDLANPRLMLGRPGGGAVQLCRAGTTLALAEGIETALSATALLGLPVWAVLGNERLPRIAIPPQVERLVLLPDADAAGASGERLARRAYATQVSRIETIWPWDGHNDWNDVLRQEGRQRGMGCGERPEGQAGRME